MSSLDRFVDELTKLNLPLFAASVAASAFMYSIASQFQRSGLPTSPWISMIHATSLAGIVFILSFLSGIVPKLSLLSTKVKQVARVVSISLLGFGLVLLLSVSVILWLNTF